MPEKYEVVETNSMVPSGVVARVGRPTPLKAVPPRVILPATMRSRAFSVGAPVTASDPSVPITVAPVPLIVPPLQVMAPNIWNWPGPVRTAEPLMFQVLPGAMKAIESTVSVEPACVIVGVPVVPTVSHAIWEFTLTVTA